MLNLFRHTPKALRRRLLRGLDKFVGNLDGCSHVTIETPLFLMTTFINYLELAREGLNTSIRTPLLMLRL